MGTALRSSRGFSATGPGATSLLPRSHNPFLHDPAGRTSFRLRRSPFHPASNRPHKAHQFPRRGGRGDRGWLATGDHAPGTAAQTILRIPCGVHRGCNWTVSRPLASRGTTCCNVATVFTVDATPGHLHRRARDPRPCNVATVFTVDATVRTCAGTFTTPWLQRSHGVHRGCNVQVLAEAASRHVLQRSHGVHRGCNAESAAEPADEERAAT